MRKFYVCHTLSIAHPSQLCGDANCPPNFPQNFYFKNLFRPNHKSYLSYYYVLVLFVFPCLLDRRVAWNSTSRCLTFETLESISNQSRIDLRCHLRSISNQSRIILESTSNQSRVNLESISDRPQIDLELISNRSQIDLEPITNRSQIYAVAVERAERRAHGA